MRGKSLAASFVVASGALANAFVFEEISYADDFKPSQNNFEILSDNLRNLQTSGNIKSGPIIEVDSTSYREKLDVPSLAGNIAANAPNLIRGDISSIGNSILHEQHARRFADDLYLKGYKKTAGHVAGIADLLDGPIPFISGLNGRGFEKQVRETFPGLDSRSNIRRLLDETNTDVYDTNSYKEYLRNPNKLNETKLAIELAEMALEKKRKAIQYQSDFGNPEVRMEVEQLHRELSNLEQDQKQTEGLPENKPPVDPSDQLDQQIEDETAESEPSSETSNGTCAPVVDEKLQLEIDNAIEKIRSPENKLDWVSITEGRYDHCHSAVTAGNTTAVEERTIEECKDSFREGMWSALSGGYLTEANDRAKERGLCTINDASPIRYSYINDTPTLQSSPSRTSPRAEIKPRDARIPRQTKSAGQAEQGKDKTYIIRPPKIWLDRGPFLHRLDE